MSVRNYTTCALALALAIVSVLSYSPYVAIPLLLVAIFFLAWGRAPQRTEAVVGSLPFGKTLLWGLAQVDKTISPPRPAKYAKSYDRHADAEGK